MIQLSNSEAALLVVALEVLKERLAHGEPKEDFIPLLEQAEELGLKLRGEMS